MIQEALQQVKGAEVLAIAGMIILLASFVAMIIWAFRLPRKHVDHMKNLPLDSDSERGTENDDERN